MFKTLWCSVVFQGVPGVFLVVPECSGLFLVLQTPLAASSVTSCYIQCPQLCQKFASSRHCSPQEEQNIFNRKQLLETTWLPSCASFAAEQEDRSLWEREWVQTSPAMMRAHYVYSRLPITRTLANSNLALTRTKIDFPRISVIHLL